MTTALATTTRPERDYWENTPAARYLRDPAFKRIVDTLEYLIHDCQYTPSELREAALLASIRYESHSLRRMIVIDASIVAPVAEDFDTARMA